MTMENGIHILQEHANEARFIMGHKMVDYLPKLESKKKKETEFSQQTLINKAIRLVNPLHHDRTSQIQPILCF